MLDKRSEKIQQMFTGIAPRYDRANRILSFRFDVAWRKYVSRFLVNRPGLVLDLAAGTGDLAVDLQHYGHHRVVAADFTFAMLQAGRAKYARQPSPIPLVTADALHLPLRDRIFDAVTVAFGVRNFSDPLRGLKEIHRVLRTGGTAGILEFSRPAAPFRYLYEFYSSRILPIIGGWITGSRAPYEYLPASVKEFPEGEQFLDLMREAGFAELSRVRLTFGIATFYRGVRP